MKITTIALIGSMLGAWFVARKSIIGFWIWLGANTLWLIDSIKRNDRQQSLLWIYYNITCVVGIVTW